MEQVIIRRIQALMLLLPVIKSNILICGQSIFLLTTEKTSKIHTGYVTALSERCREKVILRRPLFCLTFSTTASILDPHLLAPTSTARWHVYWVIKSERQVALLRHETLWLGPRLQSRLQRAHNSGATFEFHSLSAPPAWPTDLSCGFHRAAGRRNEDGELCRTTTCKLFQIKWCDRCCAEAEMFLEIKPSLWSK